MYGNPSPKFSIMEIMEIYVVLLCACTIAAIFVERGQATNVYPPREFSDNERDLTMMLTSCILYNKLLILLSITKTPIFQTLAIIACRKKNHIRHTHIFLSSPQTFIIKLHTYPSDHLDISKTSSTRSLFGPWMDRNLELCLLSFFHDTN